MKRLVHSAGDRLEAGISGTAPRKTLPERLFERNKLNTWIGKRARGMFMKRWQH